MWPTLHIERDRMAYTKDQQVKAVLIGMALGVLAQDVDAVTSRKMSLEFAFNHAWRNWRAARHFPSIKGHDPGNLFWIGLGNSERRSGACAAWAHGTWCTPYIALDDWTVAEALDLHADSNVAAQDWIELGRLVVEYFKPERGAAIAMNNRPVSDLRELACSARRYFVGRRPRRRSSSATITLQISPPE